MAAEDKRSPLDETQVRVLLTISECSKAVHTFSNGTKETKGAQVRGKRYWILAVSHDK